MLLGDRRLAYKVYVNRGLLYHEIGSHDHALPDLLNALQMSPDDVRIQHTVGLCLHRYAFLCTVCF